MPQSATLGVVDDFIHRIEAADKIDAIKSILQTHIKLLGFGGFDYRLFSDGECSKSALKLTAQDGTTVCFIVKKQTSDKDFSELFIRWQHELHLISTFAFERAIQLGNEKQLIQ